jgi:hypothetical protein
MTDFRPSFPRPNPFHCDACRHLWEHGLALAIYQTVGRLTAYGKRPFVADTAKIARFFGASETYVRRMFARLDRAGWIVVEIIEDPSSNKFIKKIPKRKVRRWISHEDWAKTHPDQCINVDELLLPFQRETDPLCGRLWATFDGKIHLYEGFLKHARSCGYSDDEIERACTDRWQEAKAKRARGEHRGTSAKAVFFAAIASLKARKDAA